MEESEAYLNSPALSKILRRLNEEKMLDNIKGKDDVKRLIPRVIRRKKFSKDPKPQGYFSFHKVTDEVEKYQRILSNPLALKHITDRLKNFGLLERAYTIIARNYNYAMMNSDERTEKFFRMGINAAAPNLNQTDSDWEAVKDHLRSLDENQLNTLINEFVHEVSNNPSGYLFLILSLPKIDFS